MQIQGYFCLGISIHWGVVLLPQVASVAADGVLTYLGLFACGGNLLLVVSLHWFQPGSEGNESLLQLMERVYTPPLLQPAATAACLASVSYLCFYLAEARKTNPIPDPGPNPETDHAQVYRDTPRAVSFLAGAFVSTAAACVSAHVLAGRHIPGFRPWQPFQGGDIFIILQAYGWLMAGCALNFCLLASHYLTPGPDQTAAGILPGILISFGAVQNCAVACLLYSLAHFEPGDAHELSQESRQGGFALWLWRVGVLLTVGPLVWIGIQMLVELHQSHWDLTVCRTEVGLRLATTRQGDLSCLPWMAGALGRCCDASFGAGVPLQRGFYVHARHRRPRRGLQPLAADERRLPLRLGAGPRLEHLCGYSGEHP